MYDDATRAKARTIAEARGLSAAATVTGVGLSTLKRWAAAEGWRTGRNRAAPSNGPVAPVAGSEQGEQKEDAAHSPTPRPIRDRAAELAEDAELARRVFRQQGEAVLDGTGKPQWFRDATVAWGIATDKRHLYGSPAGGWKPGQEFSWSGYFAQNEERRQRLREWCEFLEERAGQQGNGHGR